VCIHLPLSFDPGTNGATFFQTATVVTLVRNFPSHRGGE
jgi:hypothetical protein